MTLTRIICRIAHPGVWIRFWVSKKDPSKNELSFHYLLTKALIHSFNISNVSKEKGKMWISLCVNQVGSGSGFLLESQQTWLLGPGISLNVYLEFEKQHWGDSFVSSSIINHKRKVISVHFLNVTHKDINRTSCPENSDRKRWRQTNNKKNIQID